MQRVKSKKIRWSLEDKVYHAIAMPIFLLLAFVCIYPFWYVIIASISNSTWVNAGLVTFLPKGFNPANYVKVLTLPGLWQSVKVTVVRVLLATVLQTLCSAYMGYFFSKTNMWGRKFWYRLLAATMYFSAGMIPVYLNWKNLGLVDSFWIYIVPGLFSMYNAVLVKTSIEAMPRELEESAVIDGAGYLTRFIKIVLPLQKAILATIALFTAVNHWNDYFTSRLYINLRQDLVVLQYKLFQVLQEAETAAKMAAEAGVDYNPNSVTATGFRMALTVVVIFPVMCIYPVIQKHYVKGVMIGAVKG
jgi:multiple sugar transport system permease protein/putative aldouronate transport system permease protein